MASLFGTIHLGFFWGGGGAFSVPVRMDREPFIDGDSAGGDNVRCYLSVFILN